MAKGNVYFVGDAAHIHSPIGARGMNLGIEDAWVFAQMMQRGEIDRYATGRRKVDARVVQRVKLLTTVARGQSGFTRLLRRVLFASLPRLSFARRQLIYTATGLDHPPFSY